MSSIAELKEDKKQMEEYIAELEEDKKQMKEHYEELIAKMKRQEDDESDEEDEDDEECAECCNCGEDVSNDNGTGSLVGGEYWCKTCVEEEEDDDHDICGQTGGKCGDFAGCGKKVLCEDTNMFGNTSFCIPCYEKYEEDFKKLEEEEEESEEESEEEEEESDDEDDYKDDIDPNLLKLCGETTINFDTYKEYFAQHYKQEKEHDEDTYFQMFVYAKKDPEPYEMSAWSDIYFKIIPDGKENKSFDKIKHKHYNTSSCFAAQLCDIEFEEEEDEEDEDEE